ARRRRRGDHDHLRAQHAAVLSRVDRRGESLTYCVGVLLNDGIVLGSDSRTHAGVDDFASFCKMTVFEEPGERVLVLLSSGSLAGTQAVVSVLRQEADATAEAAGTVSIRNARTMFDVARVVSDAMRAIDRRDSEHLEKH